MTSKEATHAGEKSLHSLHGIMFKAAPWPADPANLNVVFIHGAGTSSALWETFFSYEWPKANLLAVNLPGHGDCSRSSMDMVEDYAHALLDWWEDLKLGPAVLVGHSMGGAIAQVMAFQSPEFFKGAVMINAGPNFQVEEEILAILDEDPATYFEQVKQRSFAPKADKDSLAKRLKEISTPSLKVAKADLEACREFEFEDELEEIKMPLLFLSAKQDQLVSWDKLEELTELHRHVTLKKLNNSGHFAPLENPTQLHKEILLYLEQFDQ